MESIVEVRGLTKKFGKVTAVDYINFDIQEGEIVGLVGPNGAGKTTTLHMLLGLTTPTSGDITILGMDPRKNRSEILSRVNFSSSYVSLPYSLTVRENLLIFSRLYAIPNPKKKINELLEIFEIEDIANEPTRKLSSGQVTRVSLAKALLNDPEVLFLDEPTASLDPDMADRTRTLLAEINRERRVSMLYTSHNMKEMEEMCHRLIFLDKGKIKAIGRPVDIKLKYHGDTLEDVFIKIARSGQ